MRPGEQNRLFEEWACAYQGIVFKIASAFATGVERDELAQEIFAAIWQAIPAYRGKSKPSTFVYRVAHNYALTWQRGRRNYRRKLDGYVWSGRSGDHDSVDGTERIEALYAAIRRLDALDRSIILLYLDKAAYAEIAEVLGLNANSVGVRIHRIKDKLMRLLKENSDEF
jgi:RNA polymerase sigma-70 factor (ECF subfamily)